MKKKNVNKISRKVLIVVIAVVVIILVVLSCLMILLNNKNNPTDLDEEAIQTLFLDSNWIS